MFDVYPQVKTMYPAIENACRQMEQYIGSKIETGKTVFASKDVRIWNIWMIRSKFTTVFTKTWLKF